MATAQDLERELADAFHAQRPPSFCLASISEWVKAIDAELNKGRHDLAEHAVRSLREFEPDLEWAASMAGLLDGAVAVPGDSEFQDDPAKDVQIVPRENADAAILCFGGSGQRFGMPLHMFSRWLAPFPAHVIYLRDSHRLIFMRGIRSLGSRAASIAALIEIAHDLGVRRLLCIGNSSGGYAALHYGLQLRAEAVLSLAGPVNLDPAFNLQRGRFSKKIQKRCPDEALDCRALYMAAETRPRVIIAYGEQCWDDRLQAEHMAGVPGVRLLPIPGHAKHGVIAPLVGAKSFGKLLAEFFHGEIA